MLIPYICWIGIFAVEKSHFAHLTDLLCNIKVSLDDASKYLEYIVFEVYQWDTTYFPPRF